MFIVQKWYRRYQGFLICLEILDHLGVPVTRTLIKLNEKMDEYGDKKEINSQVREFSQQLRGL